MAHLQTLDGKPMTWAELYERHAAYYLTQLEPDERGLFERMIDGLWWHYNNANGRRVLETLVTRGYVEVDRTPGRVHRYRRPPQPTPAEIETAS